MKKLMGRPKGNSGLDKDLILKTALLLLDKEGSQGLSMRALALRLNVTPMALYHHYEDRLSLLSGISDLVYSDVTRAFNSYSGPTRGRLEFLLQTYHKAVIKHPNLSIGIFESPKAFSAEAKNITDCLLELISQTKVPRSKRTVWLNILIDFTHGSAIATAKNYFLGKDNLEFIETESKRFSKELKVLLDCIFNL